MTVATQAQNTILRYLPGKWFGCRASIFILRK